MYKVCKWLASSALSYSPSFPSLQNDYRVFLFPQDMMNQVEEKIRLEAAGMTTMAWKHGPESLSLAMENTAELAASLRSPRSAEDSASSQGQKSKNEGAAQTRGTPERAGQMSRRFAICIIFII
jgi:hypothetical protein